MKETAQTQWVCVDFAVMLAELGRQQEELGTWWGQSWGGGRRSWGDDGGELGRRQGWRLRGAGMGTDSVSADPA